MENLMLVQLSIHDVRLLLRQELESYFSDNKQKHSLSTLEGDQILTVSGAAEFLDLSIPTIYGYVQRRDIPFSKRSKRLYFSKQELTAWVKVGRKKTVTEIEADADNLLNVKKMRR